MWAVSRTRIRGQSGTDSAGGIQSCGSRFRLFGSATFLSELSLEQAVTLAQYAAGENVKYQLHLTVTKDNAEDFSAALIGTASTGLNLKNGKRVFYPCAADGGDGRHRLRPHQRHHQLYVPSARRDIPGAGHHRSGMRTVSINCGELRRNQGGWFTDPLLSARLPVRRQFQSAGYECSCQRAVAESVYRATVVQPVTSKHAVFRQQRR